MAEESSGESLLGTAVNEGMRLVTDKLGGLAGTFAGKRAKDFFDTTTGRYRASQIAPQDAEFIHEVRRAQIDALEYLRGQHADLLQRLDPQRKELAEDWSFNEWLRGWVHDRLSLLTNKKIDTSSMTESDLNDVLQWPAHLLQMPQMVDSTAERRLHSARHLLGELREAYGNPIPHRFEQLFDAGANLRGWHGVWMANVMSRVQSNEAFRNQMLQRQIALALKMLADLQVPRPAAPAPPPAFELPPPMNFERYVETKLEHFFGRSKVIDRIDGWLADPGARPVMLVHGPFGVGKSALMARLYQRRGRDLTAVHFCRFDGARTLQPEHILRSIASQFARNIPAYSAALAAGKALQSALDEGNAREDPVTSWQQGVLEPLMGLGTGQPSQQHVLLIDGLDESTELQSDDGHHDLLSLISTAAASRLPAWLRVIISSRLDNRLKSRMPDFEPINLLDDRLSDHGEDLKGFIAERTQTLVKDADLAALGGAERLSEKIVALCDRKFLVAEHVFKYVESSDFSAEGLQRLLESDTLAHGMDSFLDFSFRWRVKRKGLSVEMTRAVLGIVAAARDPLPYPAIAAVLSSDGAVVAPQAVLEIIGSLGGLVRHDARFNGYTFDHLSVEQWLDPSKESGLSNGVAKAGKYAIDRAASEHLLQQQCRRLALLDRPLAQAPKFFVSYLERWGVGHLLDAGGLADAMRLLAALLAELPNRKRGDGLRESCRAQEVLVLDRLDQQFRQSDAARVPDEAELRVLPSFALRQLLTSKEYETSKYESTVRALVQYHPQEWPLIRAELLADQSQANDLVFRSDIGVAMAKAWHAAQGQARERLLAEVQTMVEGEPGGDEREIAGYALKHVCQRLEPEPWWRPIEGVVKTLINRYAASQSPVDRMVAGEALLALAVQAQPASQWVARAAGDDVFWQPHWPNLQGDIDAIAFSMAPPVGTPTPGQASCAAQKALADAIGASLRTHRLFGIGAALQEEPRLRHLVASQANQQCDKGATDEALDVLDRLADGDEAEFVFDLVRLLMLHPLWDVTECGSNLVADLIKRRRDTRWPWIDRLLASDAVHWRLRYGAIDAAYTAGTIDDYARFEQAVVQVGCDGPDRDPYGRVKGICADDLRAHVKDADASRKRAILVDGPVGGVVRHWLASADDVWLLEYLYLLMHELREAGDELQDVVQGLLPERMSPYLQLDEQLPFYDLEYDDFMRRIEAKRRAERPAIAAA